MVTCYFPPDADELCQCAGNPLRAHLCQFGHLTECHYPFDCEQAACSHLYGYGYSPDDRQALRDQAIARFRAMAAPNCQLCHGSAIRTRQVAMPGLPDFWRELAGEPVQTGLCNCVRLRAISEARQRELERAKREMVCILCHGPVQVDSGMITVPGGWSAHIECVARVVAQRSAAKPPLEKGYGNEATRGVKSGAAKGNPFAAATTLLLRAESSVAA